VENARQAGHNVGRDQVARLMRAAGIEVVANSVSAVARISSSSGRVSEESSSPPHPDTTPTPIRPDNGHYQSSLDDNAVFWLVIPKDTDN
jgi:hypothetical protein